MSRTRIALLCLAGMLIAAIVAVAVVKPVEVRADGPPPITGSFSRVETGDAGTGEGGTFEYWLEFEFDEHVLNPEAGCTEFQIIYALSDEGAPSPLQDVNVASNFPQGWVYGGLVDFDDGRQGWLMTYSVEENEGELPESWIGWHLYSPDEVYESMQFSYWISLGEQEVSSGIELMAEAEDADGDGFPNVREDKEGYDPNDPQSHPSRLGGVAKKLIKAKATLPPEWQVGRPTFTPGDEICDWTYEIDPVDSMIYEFKKTTDDGQHGSEDANGQPGTDWQWNWGKTANGWAAYVGGWCKNFLLTSKTLSYEAQSEVRIEATKTGDKCIGFVSSRAYSTLGWSHVEIKRGSGNIALGDGSALVGVARKLSSNIPGLPFEHGDGAGANVGVGGVGFAVGPVTINLDAETTGSETSQGGFKEETEGHLWTDTAWWRMQAWAKGNLTVKGGSAFYTEARGETGTGDGFVMAQLFCIDNAGAVCSLENIIWESPDPNPPNVVKPADPSKQKPPRKEDFRKFGSQHNK